MNTRTFRLAFRASLPVMAGYLVLGIGFGVLLQARGYGFQWSLLMAATIYAGSLQYASLDLISGGASLITTALLTLMLNGRHFFYGLSMLGKYQRTGNKKPYLIFALTDETYSLVCTPPPQGVEPGWYYFLVTLLDHCYWVAGCTIGGLLGPFLPFDTTGMDFAMTALFVVIVVNQWLAAKNHVPVLVGIGVSLLLLLLLGPDRFVIPAMAAVTVIMALLRGRMEAADNA